MPYGETLIRTLIKTLILTLMFFFLNTKSTKETKLFVCSVYSVFKWKRKDTEPQSFLWTQIAQIEEIFSLTLVIEIPKILKICGQWKLMFQLMSKLMSELMCYEKDALRRNIN